VIGYGVMAFGAPVEALELPEPRALRPDEVLIEVKAAGVGNWDEIAREGSWNLGVAPPLALGVEAAGIVVVAGEQVQAAGVGDAVMTHPVPLREQGAWCESLIAPASSCAPKPTHMSWTEAGCFPVPALTAAQAVAAAKVGPDDVVLVSGGGGVTGGAMVQLAARAGAMVFATAGPSSRERVEGYGASAVIDYHDDEWQDRVRDIAGAPISVVLNAARNGSHDALRVLEDHGRLATITSDPPQAERGIMVESVYVAANGNLLRDLGESWVGGDLAIEIGEVLPFDRAPSALALAASGRAPGAIALSEG
jgi:NADPH:quinone reductase-like Zn-dependent oxidoreductase